MIRELDRQAELQAQGNSVASGVERARRMLAELDDERALFQRQAARGRITEHEFDQRMDETEETQQYWQSELVRLQELRDNQARVQVGLDYATELLVEIQTSLPAIDIPPKELRKLPKEKRNDILKERRAIIRALVDRVWVYSDGRVKIEGLVDGSEAAQFDLEGWSSLTLLL